MSFQPSLDLALALLLVGVTLFVVILYLRVQSNRLRDYLLRLYQVNRDVNQDVLDFIDQAWPVLQSAGFTGLQGEVQWFGEKKVLKHGRESRVVYPVELSEWGISLRLKLCAPRLNGEKQLLAGLVLQNFKVLLELDVSNKTSQFLLSQKRLEKYQLFVQHDIKNIAQFIVLLSEQVRVAETPEQQQLLVGHLKKMMPTVTDRAHKTIEQLTRPNKPLNDIDTFSFAEVLHCLAEGLELDYVLSGDAHCTLSRTLFEQVLKSILENFRDHGARGQCVKVAIEDGCRVHLFIEADDFELNVPTERLFEPFWSSSESGMGLGLFIARELLTSIGGSITLDYSADHFGFVVQF